MPGVSASPHNVPRMRLSPMKRGFASAFGGILALAALLTFCAQQLDQLNSPPQPDLLWALASVGVGLLIAYSVALTAAEKELGKTGTREQHESWLGFVGGCGVCGLVGIATALVAACHLDAGHANLMDSIWLWWSISSIGMLGIVVAVLPIMSYEWRQG